MGPSTRVVAVTGASGGIGLAIARHRAELGDRVLITGRRLGPLQSAATALGPRVSPLVADSADPASAALVVSAAVERFGPAGHGVLNGLRLLRAADRIEHLQAHRTRGAPSISTIQPSSWAQPGRAGPTRQIIRIVARCRPSASTALHCQRIALTVPAGTVPAGSVRSPSVIPTA